MNSVKSLLSLVAVLILLFVGHSLLTTASAQTAPPPSIKFSGKVLSIAMRSNTEDGAVLEGVELRQIAGEQFLVGKGVLDGWTKGRPIWIAVGHIAQIVEFESVEKYVESVEKYKDAR